MKMKPTSKDFYMEIRKSPGRFLSILFIVALGVAFFSGIRASEPDMRLTGDAYFDESNLMDIKALSTYGVTQDDVDAISKIDGVEHAEGAYSADFMQIVDKKQKVLHVISLQDEMTQVKLSDGRMPQKAGECLADQDAEYKVGDTIQLRSGTSDEVTDTLTTDTLKVVGLCSNPMYISYGRGSATIGTGTISAFVMVPEETFDMDVYTEVYVQVKGAKNEIAFTDGYDKKVKKVLDQIEDITDERAEIRKQELVNEAQEKIDEAREELEQGRADAASELADAAAKIADAEEQLTSGKAQITSGKKQIASAKNTLSKKESELEQAQNQYNAGLAQLQEGEAQYEAGLAQYEAAKPEAEAKIQAGREGLVALEQMIQADQQTLTEIQQGIESVTSALSAFDSIPEDQLTKEQKEQKTQYEQKLAELKENEAGMQQKISIEQQKYDESKAELDAAQKQLDDSIYGIEKKPFPYLLCVTNMLLHDIEIPNIYHMNSLKHNLLDYTDDDKFDVILMNPPYGGHEDKSIQGFFPDDLASSETADLFMSVILYRLKKNGRAAVIVPDGFLFGLDNAKVNIKKKLIGEFNLHTVVRLPSSVFSPYTSITTNLLFFDNTKPTTETWFYRVDIPSDRKHFSKTKPMELKHFEDCITWWNNREIIPDGEYFKAQKFTADYLLNEQGCNIDLCGYPHEEEEVLDPLDTIREYQERRTTLNAEIDKVLAELEALLPGGVKE